MSILNFFHTKDTKVTQVDAKVFKEMVTNEGLSISQMNDMGVKVILFFSTSLACPYCQGTIDDIYELKMELAKLNIVPIVCHEETDETWEEFVDLSSANKKFGELLHLNRTKWNKNFKLESSVGSLIMETLGAGLQELKRLKSNGIKGKLSWFKDETKNLLAAVFVVANSQIVSEYRKSTKHERIDLAKVVIEPNLAIEVHTSYYSCDYVKKSNIKRSSKDLSEKRRRSRYETLKAQDEQLQELGKLFEKNELTLKDVLGNDSYRQHFKMFCLNQFCIENIIFFEETAKYKASDKEKRRSIGENILNTFFVRDGIFEINTNDHFIDDAKKKIFENDEDAFDQILKEVQTEILTTVFNDFKKSAGYITMIMSDQKTEKLNPVSLNQPSQKIDSRKLVQ